jgi:hypothetical protein
MGNSDSVINISLEESVCGISIGLSFRVSSEAFLREIEDAAGQDGSLYTQAELMDELNREVLSQTRDLLGKARMKLRSCMVCSYSKNLQLL